MDIMNTDKFFNVIKTIGLIGDAVAIATNAVTKAVKAVVAGVKSLFSKSNDTPGGEG